eukprot:7353966-Alexandrium_andersonii.AAC.1
MRTRIRCSAPALMHTASATFRHCQVLLVRCRASPEAARQSRAPPGIARACLQLPRTAAGQL